MNIRLIAGERNYSYSPFSSAKSIFVFLAKKSNISESVVALSLWGCNMRFHPLIQHLSCCFSRLKRVCRTQTFTSIEHNISSLHSRFWVQLSAGSPFLPPDKTGNSCDVFIIREYGSTLYAGLQLAVPPTNTKFKPLLLPTQADIQYTKLSSTEHQISSLHSYF